MKGREGNEESLIILRITIFFLGGGLEAVFSPAIEKSTKEAAQTSINVAQSVEPSFNAKTQIGRGLGDMHRKLGALFLGTRHKSTRRENVH